MSAVGALKEPHVILPLGGRFRRFGREGEEKNPCPQQEQNLTLTLRLNTDAVSISWKYVKCKCRPIKTNCERNN